MGQNWAIAIGVNQYYNLRPLKYAKQDAQAIRDFCLNEAGFKRVYYFAEDAPLIETDYGPPLQSAPTVGNLERFLEVRFEQSFLDVGDNLWFFFAGHGKRHQGRDYLMPIDGSPGNVARTSISIRDIADRLRSSGADNVILMLHPCAPARIANSRRRELRHRRASLSAPALSGARVESAVRQAARADPLRDHQASYQAASDFIAAVRHP